MRTRTFRCALAALGVAVLAVLLSTPAQAQVTARIEGTVTDEAGNPLENVEVYLKNADTNATPRPAKTRKNGKYLWIIEPSGYFMWAKLEGYVVVKQLVEITNAAGQKTTNAFFYDDKQNFDKKVRFFPQGDLNSKVRQKVDFVLTTPDKLIATVNRLYAEFHGAKEGTAGGGGGGFGGAAPAPPAETQKDPLDEAIDLLAQKDYNGAIPLLKAKIEKDPENTDAYYQLGRASVETENWAEAEPALKKAKQLDPTKPGVSFYLARMYDKKGRKVQAIQALEDEKAINPESEAVLDNLGGLYADTGQNDKAVESLEALVQAHPDHLDAYLSLAALYKTMGNTAKEEEMYKLVGDKDPKGDALYNLGNLAFNHNEPDKASLYYKQVLQKNPNHAKAHLQLAYTLVNLGDLPGAISQFETFLKLSPKDDKAAEAKATMDELKKMVGKAPGKG